MERRGYIFIFNYYRILILILEVNKRIKLRFKNLFRLNNIIKTSFENPLLIFIIFNVLIDNYNYNNLKYNLEILFLRFFE